MPDTQKTLSNVTLLDGQTYYFEDESARAMPASVEEGSTASKSYAIGDLLVLSGKLYKVTSPISSGGTFVVGTNIVLTTINAELKTIREDKTLGLSNTAVGDLVRVASIDANGKPTSWRKAPLCEIRTNPNLLDNWYFVGGGSQQGDGIFPINQRGDATYPNAGNCIDRWRLARGSITLQADGLLCTSPSDTTFRIDQRISYEVIKSVLGKPCTISALVNNTLCEFNISSLSETAQNQSFNVDGVNVYIYAQFDTAWGNVYRPVQFYVEANKSATLKAIKFEFGTEQTLVHQEGSAWVLNEIPDYEIELIKCKTSTDDPSDTYANKTIGYNVSNPNLLDNWYFVGGGSQQGGGQFPINQRGQSIYPNPGDCIDRWTSSGTFYISQNWINMAANTSITQKLESALKSSLNGKNITLSLVSLGTKLTSGTVVYQSAPESAITVVSDSNFTLSITITGDIELKSANAYASCQAIKLELGSEQTLAHQENGQWVLNEIPDYVQELLKCQRCFQMFRTEALRPTYGADCRPAMAADEPTKSTRAINGVTYYTLEA